MARATKAQSTSWFILVTETRSSSSGSRSLHRQCSSGHEFIHIRIHGIQSNYNKQTSPHRWTIVWSYKSDGVCAIKSLRLTICIIKVLQWSLQDIQQIGVENAIHLYKGGRRFEWRPCSLSLTDVLRTPWTPSCIHSTSFDQFLWLSLYNHLIWHCICVHNSAKLE